MNNTFKNSIVGALAILGLVTFLSSATSSPTVVHEGSNTPESHVWSAIQAHENSATGNGKIVLFNKKTGESKVVTSYTKGTGVNVKFNDWVGKKKQ